MDPHVRLLALNGAPELLQATIHRICGDRVLSRGDKHQTLRADTLAKSHEDVIWLFIRTSEDLADSEVDTSIEMDLEDDLEQAVKRAVTGCVNILGLQEPSAEEIDEAVRKARNCKPQTKKHDDKKTKKKDGEPTPRYFSLLLELDLFDVVGKRMEMQN